MRTNGRAGRIDWLLESRESKGPIESFYLRDSRCESTFFSTSSREP